jgi:hypothetical protein
MSKHSTSDEKLRISPPVRPQNGLAGRRSEPKENSVPQTPRKGTNSLNQYR